MKQDKNKKKKIPQKSNFKGFTRAIQKKPIQSRSMEGIISVSSKATGYIEVPGQTEDAEIDYRHLNTALNGDTVKVLLHPKGHGRQTAEVTEILTRAKKAFVGVLEKEDALYFLKPDDTKMYTDILIPESELAGAVVNQKVFVELTSWKDHKKAPIGKVIKILGRPGDNETEMHSIAIEKGFDSVLPDHVELEARNIKIAGVKPEDFKNRRDFRGTLTFTIDPDTAKDFDDALSFKELGPDEFEIGIHIADVTHYVKEGGAIDKEARERATSVYLVDRTIPMLPEELSNDLCSLLPDVDRLTMSAVFVMNKNAEIKSEWYGRTVIHSDKRFTYEEAFESIQKPNLLYHKELSTLNTIAKKLTKDRFEHGSVSLDQEEVKFILDETGKPIKVIKKERTDSNRLIEEFMLLANKKVAEFISKKIKKEKEGIFVYRIHDLPSKEKTEDLVFFLKSLGYKVALKNGLIPSFEINKLLNNLKNKDEKDTIHRAVIRSMAKAIYSTENIGHYGLAFEYYTHFTSPIRRYPDMMVHRLLMNYLSDKKIKKEMYKEFDKMSRVSSEQEKKASDAERASIKYKQVEYMSTRIGENFKGIISGISEWGVYVEEVETKCEGLVRVRDMKDDFYVFDEKKMEMVGQKHKTRYRLGNHVKMKVKSVDLEKKTIDYVLI
jgi:ribonuclease R